MFTICRSRVDHDIVFMMIDAVIFDMDGLMIDSEPIHSLTFESLVKAYGKKPLLRNSGIIHEPGLRERENWEKIMRTHGFLEDTKILAKKRHKVLLDLLPEVVKMQTGLVQLLELLKQNSIKIAIGSSSTLEFIDKVLDALRIAHYFDAIVSGMSVARGKPFPDIFLEAANQLNVRPERCVVLEDTETGVRAAKAAGMKVVVVPTKYTGGELSGADLVVSRLDDVTIEMLTNLQDDGRMATK